MVVCTAPRALCSLSAWHIRFRTIQSIIITLASAKGSYYYISYCKERGAGNKGNNPCRPNCHNHPPLTLYYSAQCVRACLPACRTHTPLPAPAHTERCKRCHSFAMQILFQPPIISALSLSAAERKNSCTTKTHFISVSLLKVFAKNAKLELWKI